MTITHQWEKDLKDSGWQPVAAHPNSPVWRDPEGTLYPGPGYAWLVMKELEGKNQNV